MTTWLRVHVIQRVLARVRSMLERPTIGAVVFLSRKGSSIPMAFFAHEAELCFEIHFGGGDSRHGHWFACVGASNIASCR